MDLALDFPEPGEWPLLAKVATLSLLWLLVLGGGYFFIIQDKSVRLERLNQQESVLRATFESQLEKASQIAAYQTQLAELTALYSVMLAQFSDKSDVAELLEGITRAGLMHGLEFELLRHEAEQLEALYVAQPITIMVTGSYHQFGLFLSELSSLPRIITLDEIKLEPANQIVGRLAIEMKAKTYRFIEE